jgi:hypothetical protein
MFNIFEYIIASANVAQPIPSLVLGVPASALSAKMVKHPGSRKLQRLTQLFWRQIACSSSSSDDGEDLSSTETIVDSEDRKKKKGYKRKQAEQEKRQAKRAIEMTEKSQKLAQENQKQIMAQKRKLSL